MSDSEQEEVYLERQAEEAAAQEEAERQLRREAKLARRIREDKKRRRRRRQEQSAGDEMVEDHAEVVAEEPMEEERHKVIQEEEQPRRRKKSRRSEHPPGGEEEAHQNPPHYIQGINSVLRDAGQAVPPADPPAHGDEPAAAEDEFEVITTFRSPYAVDFSNYVEPQAPDPNDPDFCAACYFGVRADDAPSNWGEVVKYMQLNRGKVKALEYVRRVQTLYYANVQPYVVGKLDKTARGKPWMAQQIYDHERSHGNRPGNVIHELYESQLFAFREMRDKETFQITTTVNKRTGEVTTAESVTGKCMQLAKLAKEILPIAVRLQQLENNYVI